MSMGATRADTEPLARNTVRRQTPNHPPRRCEQWQRSWPTLRRHSATCSRSARSSRNWPAATTRSICARCPRVWRWGRRLGFTTDTIDPRIEAIVHEDWKASNPRAALKMAVDVFCRRAVYEVADFTDAVTRTRPDTLIVDVNSWGCPVGRRRG